MSTKMFPAADLLTSKHRRFIWNRTNSKRSEDGVLPLPLGALPATPHGASSV
jgi:hypothetical protein